jgi:hypothetical protein
MRRISLLCSLDGPPGFEEIRGSVMYSIVLSYVLYDFSLVNLPFDAASKLVNNHDALVYTSTHFVLPLNVLGNSYPFPATSDAGGGVTM